MKSFEQVMELTSTVSSSTAFEDAECRALYGLCMAVPEGGVVIEIGCQLGRTSSIIAQVGLEAGYRSYHVDPYTSQPDYLKGWIEMMHRIGSLFTLMCMRTDQVKWQWLPKADLFLIDGDHTEHGVWIDCEVAVRQTKQGGHMAAHDYGRESLPDVYKVVNQATAGWWWQQVGTYGTLGVWRRV